MFDGPMLLPFPLGRPGFPLTTIPFMSLVFLSGGQRSGKTLAQLILGSRPQVSISPGTRVIERILARSPESTSRALCGFLDVDFVPEMLVDYRTNDACRQTTDTTHPETYLDITTSMIGEWRSTLDTEQIDGIAGNELAAHGYEASRIGSRVPPSAIRRGAWIRRRHYARWWASHRRRMRAVGLRMTHDRIDDGGSALRGGTGR